MQTLVGIIAIASGVPVLAWFLGSWIESQLIASAVVALQVIVILWAINQWREMRDVDGVKVIAIPISMVLGLLIFFISRLIHHSLSTPT